jgi:alpha-tubulin suppressor-like RCC1 family protein
MRVRASVVAIALGACGGGRGAHGVGAAGTASAVEHGPPRAVQVVAGRYHTCVRWDDGVAACAGHDGHGQLGGGGDVSSPVALPASAPIAGIVASEHGTCWTDTAGERTCAGLRAYDAPARATDGRGAWHMCTRDERGAVTCVGDDAFGQLGAGDDADHAGPVTVAGIDDATALAAGEAHTCALLASGSVVCWGANVFGQLGDGTRERRVSPVVFVRPSP